MRELDVLFEPGVDIGRFLETGARTARDLGRFAREQRVDVDDFGDVLHLDAAAHDHARGHAGHHRFLASAPGHGLLRRDLREQVRFAPQRGMAQRRERHVSHSGTPPNSSTMANTSVSSATLQVST